MSAVGRYHSLAARRAVFQWAWRMFRREWRQQLLVLLLLLAAVTGCGGSYRCDAQPGAR